MAHLEPNPKVAQNSVHCASLLSDRSVSNAAYLWGPNHRGIDPPRHTTTLSCQSDRPTNGI